jgi:hypothetical protein
MTGGPAPALVRLVPAARAALVVLAAGLGWWLTGPDGAPYLAALAGAAAGLAAIGLEWSLRGVAPRRVLGGLAGLAAAWPSSWPWPSVGSGS